MNSQVTGSNLTVRLHIGLRQSEVWLHPDEPPATPDAVLALEVQRLHAGWHPQHLPTLQALELAIDVVEEQMMAITKRITPGATLMVASEIVDMSALISAGASHNTNRFTTDQVEEAFSRLVAGTSRRGANDVQASATDAASLLILREFMHHGGFVAAQVKPYRNH